MVWSHHNYMVHITEGKKIWKTKNGKHLLQKGDTAFISKGCNTKKQLFEGEFTAVFLFIPDKVIHSIEKELRLNKSQASSVGLNDAVIPMDHDLMLDSYFLSIGRLFHQIDIPPLDLLEIKFKELLSHIWSSPMHRALANQLDIICDNGGNRIKQIMEENFIYPLIVEEYAQICNRSLSSFKRDFRTLYKTSPGRWLNNHRLEHARTLLQTKNKSTDDVARESGFEKASLFLSAYKRKYQHSPGMERIRV